MLSWPSWNRINNGTRGTKYRLATDGFIVWRSLGGPNAKRYITWRARNVSVKANPLPQRGRTCLKINFARLPNLPPLLVRCLKTEVLRAVEKSRPPRRPQPG